MAFPLDQGLRLDSPWSSGDLYFVNSLEDHGVSGHLVLHKIALDISVWQRCRPLQLALVRLISCSAGRDGVSILGDTAPSQEAFLPFSAVAGHVAQAMVLLQRFCFSGVW